MFRIFKFFLFTSFLLSWNAFGSDFSEVRIIIKDNKFSPSEVKVESGKKIKLVIENHDNTVEEFESADLNREKIVPAGGSVNIVLAPLKPGLYKFFGDFHQETAQGSLIVE
jgi:plastocyanin